MHNLERKPHNINVINDNTNPLSLAFAENKYLYNQLLHGNATTPDPKAIAINAIIEDLKLPGLIYPKVL